MIHVTTIVAFLFAPAICFAGEPTKEDVGILIKALKHDDRMVRRKAVGALTKLGPKAKAAVPALLDVLRNSDWPRGAELGRITDMQQLSKWEFGSPVSALIAIGPAAVPDVVKAAESDDIQIAEGATVALARIRPTSKEVVTTLTNLLSGSTNASRRSEYLRRAAVKGLWQISYEKKVSIENSFEAIHKALSDESFVVRFWAATTLSAFNKEERARAMAVLLKALKKDREDTAALAGFAAIGPQASESIPMISTSLKSRNRHVRRAAIHAIGSVARPETAVPLIEKFLGDEFEEVRQEAVETLGRMGPAAKDAIPELEEALRLEVLLGADPKQQGMARVLTKALRKIKSED